MVPTDYTHEEIAAALHDAGGYISNAAKILRCSSQVLGKYVRSHTDLQDIQLDARDEILDQAERGLKLAVYAEKAWAIKFVLARLGKERGYGQKLELAGSLGLSDNMRIFEFPDDGREAKPDAERGDQTARRSSDASVE